MSAAKPGAIKAVQGRHGAAEAAAYEPAPGELTRLSSPVRLSAEARAVWEREAPVLREAGMLTRADVMVFAQYCVATGLWRRALKGWREAGEPMMTTGPNGLEYEHPLVKQIRETQRDSQRVAEQLGLTPSARARLGLSLAEQVKQRRLSRDDPESRFFG